MESIVYKHTEMVDGRISAVYLVRDNATVRMADVLVPSGTNLIAYGIDNATTLFDIGYTPPSKVSPMALFQASKNKHVESIHMGAIYAAFEQLQMGGSMADMKVAAKQVYAQNDEARAALLAFINTFKTASQEDKDELLAIAIYAASSLVTL